MEPRVLTLGEQSSRKTLTDLSETFSGQASRAFLAAALFRRQLAKAGSIALLLQGKCSA